MKLITTIKPRRDGAVNVTGVDGKKYTFVADEAGDLVCDVTDEATVGRLLVNEHFYPAEESDHEAALALANKASAQAAGGGEGDQGDGEDGDDGEDDPVDMNALPIEGNTPPAVAPGKAPKKPKA